MSGLENGVSQYPTLEGRFPQVAGVEFAFDPSKPPGSRVNPRYVRIQGEYIDLDKVGASYNKTHLSTEYNLSSDPINGKCVSNLCPNIPYTGKIAAPPPPHTHTPIFPYQSQGAAIFPGANCHQSSTIPPWPAGLRLTRQSLKRVGHEGKPCLKGEQRHPLCLSRVPLS